MKSMKTHTKSLMVCSKKMTVSLWIQEYNININSRFFTPYNSLIFFIPKLGKNSVQILLGIVTVFILILLALWFYQRVFRRRTCRGKQKLYAHSAFFKIKASLEKF